MGISTEVFYGHIFEFQKDKLDIYVESVLLVFFESSHSLRWITIIYAVVSKNVNFFVNTYVYLDSLYYTISLMI